MAKIRWVEILPWFPGYWISDNGKAIGLKGYELTQQPLFGYYRIRARDRQCNKRWLRVNRVVCWYFNGPFPDDGIYYDAAHLDSNRSNNWWWNLEWQTRAVNDGADIRQARISAALAGKKKSDEHRRKISEGLRRYHGEGPGSARAGTFLQSP